MNRRGFFATLFAPLIARFLPKPKPAGEVIWWMKSGQSITPFIPRESQLLFLESTANGAGSYYKNMFMKARQLGGPLIGGADTIVPGPRFGFKLTTKDGMF